ncbi:serine/threonine-protein phosphatase [Streptomyces sp. PCS3-D2]|uniref:PP2C family protein-serine/threonine phosphatase n=1 Tax=Streptomyces sp. PCS3-D2 TaxID=1460244 RepID=UPI00044F9C42|nr:PP2C family protein-serine/threonine phosphatase [Streptomyces sp. PCS3-D2]WKV75751.1 serine/threonine-protein phosphatase [Streptomyces sp. PCS3-D2]
MASDPSDPSDPYGPRARMSAMEEAVDRIGTSSDEVSVWRELAEFLVDGPCDAVAVELTGGRNGPGGRVAAAGDTAGLLDPPHGPPASTHVVPVPLAGRGEVYGRLLAARADTAFGADEAATVRFAARLACVHVGHARRLAATEEIALDLQRALVAEPGRPHPNLEVASRYLPMGSRALVGGDWFETVRLHFGRTLLVIGDVMGHGLEAAVDMNAYRSTLRDVASTDLAPHRVLRQLDTLAAAEDDRRPATCLLVRVDPARRTAAYASAGHLPPAAFTANGPGTLLDVPVGPPLGTGIGDYEAVALPFTADQTILLYTDGLVERRGEDIDASLARLAALRMPAGSRAPEVVDRVCTGLDARHAEDDVAVLAARLRLRPPPEAAAR